MESISTILTSAITATVIAGLFNLYLKNQEYKNTYSKMILEKRITAYEHIQLLISTLKTSTFDDDNQSYHLIFVNEDSFSNYFQLLLQSRFHELWITNKTKDSILHLQKELTICSERYEETKNLITIGKQEYIQIAKLRDIIEINLVEDLTSLYRIDKFFSNKTVTTSFKKRNLKDISKV